MKKSAKKILSCFLSVVTLTFTIPLIANATQSRDHNFSKSYFLNGNPADDMLSVAQAQIGKTKSDLGYTEAWCADFVADCAKLAGQSSAIPENGKVSSLRDSVENAGGKEVTSRQKGDLIFYYCSACNAYVHVGIVLDSTYTIEGNYSRKVTKVSGYYSDEYKHSTSNYIQKTYVRPAYQAPNAPTSVNLSIDRNEIRAGSEFKLTCSSDVVCSYYISIWDKDGNMIIGENMNGNTFSTAFVRCGEYSAHVSGFNNKGSVDSNWVTFYIYDVPPTEATLTVNSKEIPIGDEIVLSNSSNTYYARYYMAIFLNGIKIDEGFKPERYSFVPTEIGEYSAYASAHTVDGGVDSNWVTFHVVPASYTIKYNANGGTNAPKNQTKIYGKPLTLSSTKPIRSGYTFLGWNTNSNAASATYSAGDNYTNNADATLYAVWGKNHTHSYTSSITKAATCTQTGIKTFKCSTCGNTYTETIPATGHKEVIDKAIAATCKSEGKTQGSHCSVCGYVIKAQTVIKKTPHTYTSTVKDPTCTENGAKIYTCSVCGGTYSEAIPAIGHIDDDNDGMCDLCNKDLGGGVTDCTHICHKGGFAGFIYKIILVFWKLFKINQTCSCGKKHY